MPLKVGVLSHCWPAKACQFPAVMCRAAMRRCCFKVCVCLSLHISGCFSSKDFPKEPECKTTPWVLCFWVSFFFWHKWRQNVWKPQTWQVPRSFRCRCHREMGLYLHLPWRSQDTNEMSPTLSRLPAMIHTKLTELSQLNDWQRLVTERQGSQAAHNVSQEYFIHLILARLCISISP